jgi:hypothetical protein
MRKYTKVILAAVHMEYQMLAIENLDAINPHQADATLTLRFLDRAGRIGEQAQQRKCGSA